MISAKPAFPRRLPAPVLLAASLCCCGSAIAQTPPLRAAALQPARGVELNYDLDSIQEPAGRLESVVRGWRGEWRSGLRIDPAATHQPLARLDTSWRLRPAGADTTVVIGDTEVGGLAAAPLRLGGIRIGGSQPVRLAPVVPALSLDPSPAVEQLRQAAHDLATAELPVGSYELEAGRLRSGWGTPEDRYGQAYGAAAWRGALAGDVMVQARAEWTPLHAATGVELASRLGAGASLRALIGQAGNAQGSGLHWGVGVVRSSDGSAWSLAWDETDRGYTPLASGGEAAVRARLHGAASLDLPLGRAALSYTRQTDWNAAEAQVLGLAGSFSLADQRQLTLSYAVRQGDQPGHRIGLTLVVPLAR